MIPLALVLQLSGALPAPDTTANRELLRTAITAVASRERPVTPGIYPLFLDLSGARTTEARASLPVGDLRGFASLVDQRGSEITTSDDPRQRNGQSRSVRDDGMIVTIGAIARTDSLVSIECATERTVTFAEVTGIIKREWRTTFRREGDRYVIAEVKLLRTP